MPATMVHGDFHPDHIFVDNDVATVDFERFCMSDPALDLGSFIAHTRTMACVSGRALHAANREVDALLESYFGAVPFPQRVATARRIPLTSFCPASRRFITWLASSKLWIRVELPHMCNACGNRNRGRPNPLCLSLAHGSPQHVQSFSRTGTNDASGNEVGTTELETAAARTRHKRRLCCAASNVARARADPQLG